ncbi:MAG: DUF1926 domain-containing protein [Ignavibacteriales bacterium]|nr:DUF1926 domain-containing protein [Ignavibacteriales bacterium]
MKKINLVLGIHNHQPIGNFDFVFEHAHQHAYQPFLDLLEKYPRVKLTQHYSGILLEWLLQHRPGFIRQLKRLVASGQVEIMGGAYYEAILSIIPDDDKAGQLNLLSKTIKKQFGEAPTGMWLAERVWEQHLAKCIAEAGLQYTVVDDTHFKYAGFSEEELLGYYVTEEQGNKIAMFPISKRLRYTIPFQPVHRTIDYLREIATEEGNQLAVFADDGEKFGVWPNTFDHVYTRGWLEDFFQALSDNADWIHLVRFKDVLKTIPPLGLTYLPNASYAEMLHWALPSHHFSLYEEFERALQEQGVRDKYESFFKGGFWRNFLAKYPESNKMHKKMLHVSQRAQRLEATRSNGLNRAAFARIRGHIFASQCNDPYWHGIFGGVYLPVLRYPIYSNLIAAEKELDTLERLHGTRMRTVDYDCDGHDEVVVETPTMNCYFKPEEGGSLVELDFKPANLNVLDIVSRREEGYHAKLKHAVPQAPQDAVASIHETIKAKESGLERYLVYDRYPRASLIDHFFAPGTTLEQVTRGSYEEVGDFVHQPYTVKTSKNGTKGIVELSRHGNLLQGGKRHSLFLRKTITVDFKGGMLAIDYMLRNEEQEPVPIMFGVEFNVGLQDGKAPNRYYYLDTGSMDDATLSSMGQLCDSSALGLRDEWLGVDIRIETTRAATLWRFPLEVVSLSEAGFERIFQSSVVIPFWQVTLAKEWRVGIRHTFKTLKQ